MMKKLIAMVMAASMMVLTACGGAKPAASDNAGQSDTKTETQTAASDNKMVFVIAGGKLGDQGANDASWSGIQKYAEETGAESVAFELAELQDFDGIARSYCDKGFNLVICNSSAVAEFVTPVAESYPDVKFIIMEGNVKTATENVLNIRTRIAEAGFVSGAFAALMNKELAGKAETAFIGGTRNPDLDRSQFGFAAGAQYVGGNSTAVYVGNFTDAAKAKELTTQLLSGDVRVVQAWAGGANTGVFEAAKSMGEGYYAMGGATGQFHMSDSIIASQVKNNDVMMYDACVMAYGDTWKAGTIDLGLADDAVGIKYAPDGRDAAVTQEIKDIVEVIRGKVISGEIVAPSTEEEFKQFNATMN